MATVMLVLDDALEYDFTVIAIHCSLEDYRLAFLINKHLGLHLERTGKDIDYKMGGYSALFPLYTFDDTRHYITYSLVANKCKTKISGVVSNNGLFDLTAQENYKSLNLLPEYKKADYLLKIETDSNSFAKAVLLANLNQIPQIVTAYEAEVNQLKSKKNLIFE
ncbi:MAG: IPExxxVDY family protein [Leeuwenhoekiella sp.]